MEVEWIGGHIPTAYFQDADGNTVHEEKLENLDIAGLTDWFADKAPGFVPQLKDEL